MRLHDALGEIRQQVCRHLAPQYTEHPSDSLTPVRLNSVGLTMSKHWNNIGFTSFLTNISSTTYTTQISRFLAYHIIRYPQGQASKN